MESNQQIKLIRKSLKLSQKDFGDKIGLSNTAISKLETGENSLTEQNILSICRTYNVNRDWLETGDGEMFLAADGDLIAMIDDLMTGENDFAKSVFRQFAKFSDEDWQRMQKFCEDVIADIKKTPQE